ncbi:MAG: restriction endonuclease, partial [Mogibacterium sp.]|nr:restriction endonuclease [Mogibacterium sp.]
MNKGAIKSFAIWARNKLMADVKSNAYLIGIREDGIQDSLPQSTIEVEYYDIGSAEPYAVTGDDLRKRDKIISRLQYDINDSDYNTAYRNLLEHTASTWFNRLCAIRFMEVNDYFDDGLRVLSSSEEGKRESDLMSSPFDSDIEFTEAERIQIRDWKLSNKSEELFAFLLKKKCRQLSEFLPGLFETEDDCTDLLVRFSIFDKAGIIDHLVNDIDEEDWKEQVQIIGWLYQFYNTEFKDETYRLLKKQNLTKERIPSVTQLFTPEWIVKYMVENSLGRIWLDGHPYSRLEFLPTESEQADYAAGKRDADDHKWHYYLEEAEQEPEVQTQLEEIRKEYAALNPEDLSFIDPCLGSGHIVCYAFDVLMQIYTEQGYTARDAVRSIIENNL